MISKKFQTPNIDDLVKSLSFRIYRETVWTVLTGARNTNAFAVFSADHLCWHCHFAAFCTGFWACQGCIRRHCNVYFFCGENIAKRFWKKISCFEYLLTPFFSFACRVWRNGFIKPAEFFSEFAAISIIFIAGKPKGHFAWAVKDCICVFPLIFENMESVDWVIRLEIPSYRFQIDRIQAYHYRESKDPTISGFQTVL